MKTISNKSHLYNDCKNKIKFTSIKDTEYFRFQNVCVYVLRKDIN